MKLNCLAILFIVLAMASAVGYAEVYLTGRSVETTRIQVGYQYFSDADPYATLTSLAQWSEAGNEPLGEMHRAVLAKRESLEPGELLKRLREAGSAEGFSARLLSDIGVAELVLGHFESAAQSLRESTELDGRNARSNYNYGLALSRMGDTDKAIEAYRRALELHPAHQAAALNLGISFLREDAYSQAITHLEQAVVLASGRVKASALHALGLAEIRSDQPVLAAQHFSEAIEWKPNYPEAWLSLGLAESKVPGREAAAESAYGRALALRPSYARAYYNLGVLMARLGRTKRAQANYESALVADPFHFKARSGLARLQREQGNIQGARSSYTWLAHNGPGGSDADYSLGNVALLDGDIERAAVMFQNAVDDGTGEYADALSKLGLVLRKLDRYDEALAAYEEYLVQYPDTAVGEVGVASTLLAMGRPREAFEHVEFALIASPQSTAAWFLKARLLEHSGDRVGAIAAYKKTLELKPGYRSALLNLAVLLRREQDLAGAVDLYSRILDQHPSYGPALFNLALARSAQDRLEDAAKLYDRLLAVDPDHRAAKLNLAVVLRKIGLPDRAAELLRDSVEQNPSDVSARYNLALLLGKEKEFDEAIFELQQITLLDPEFVKAWKTLGRLQEAKGDKRAAAKSYRVALARDPHSRLARMGIQRCTDSAPEMENIP